MKNSKRARDRDRLAVLMRQHEKLMNTDPYPHAGWALCSCVVAVDIRVAINDLGRQELLLKAEREAETEPIHGYFGLSYASYLVLPRVMLQSMPEEWQRGFVRMLEELGDAVSATDPDGVPKDATYWVRLRDSKGHFVHDPYQDYDRGRRRLPLKRKA
jgi:hypothetical protein